MTFYNKNGNPIAYTDDHVHIYLFSGKPAAYLDEDTVYGFNGKHIGWFENGWIRDLNGACVFFTESSTDSGLVKPVKHICPVKCVKHVLPVKCVKQIKRVRSINQLNWSIHSDESFFINNIRVH
jgi:hypothetical protein